MKDLITPGKAIVAVSGGVDSVVLLHMLVNQNLYDEMIVAHFDHGIRSNSAEDAQFVERLAEDYGLAYVTKREELGVNASEDVARVHRYNFLRNVARENHAVIVTAHHADDIVETIAINLIRGTGWRGLAVLDSLDIDRPLLEYRKHDLYEYARVNQLTWREDLTNESMKYLRNRLRLRAVAIDRDSHELIRLYRKRQLSLKKAIKNEIEALNLQMPYKRHLFIMLPENVAMEVLREVVVYNTGKTLLSHQLRQGLHAIKTFHAGKQYQAGEGVILTFTSASFIVEH
jgi:tRNA(Ile)-lysidine synthetase-like protein